MITFKETVTTERTLSNAEEIADYIAAEYERRSKATPFQPGDRVRITKREGIPPAFMVGDVGTVLLCDVPFSPLTTVLGLNDAGMMIQFPVQTANLEKAEA